MALSRVGWEEGGGHGEWMWRREWNVSVMPACDGNVSFHMILMKVCGRFVPSLQFFLKNSWESMELMSNERCAELGLSMLIILMNVWVSCAFHVGVFSCTTP